MQQTVFVMLSKVARQVEYCLLRVTVGSCFRRVFAKHFAGVNAA
jgi:hypothetical protein